MAGLKTIVRGLEAQRTFVVNQITKLQAEQVRIDAGLAALGKTSAKKRGRKKGYKMSAAHKAAIRRGVAARLKKDAAKS